MDPLRLTPEETLTAIRWRLGVPVGQDLQRSAGLWQAFRGDPDFREIAENAAQRVAGLYRHAIRGRLELIGIDAVHDSLANVIRGWLDHESARRSPYLNKVIAEGVVQHPAVVRQQPQMLFARIISGVTVVLSKLGPNPEQLVQAIRWRLGVPVGNDPARYQKTWRAFRGSYLFGEQAECVAANIARMYQSAVRQKLDLTDPDETKFHESLLDSLRLWIASAEDPQGRSTYLSTVIMGTPLREEPKLSLGSEAGAAMTQPLIPLEPSSADNPGPSAAPAVVLEQLVEETLPKVVADAAASTPTNVIASAAGGETEAASIAAAANPEMVADAAASTPTSVIATAAGGGTEAAPVAAAPNPEMVADAAASTPTNVIATAAGEGTETAPIAAAANPETVAPDQAPKPPPPLAARPVTPPPGLWKYIPVPPGSLDYHDDSYSEFKDLGKGWKILGARVRGRTHKRDGSNCDDWFEFGTAGDWTIIAVSDGAGSYKLSRVGARHSTKRALEFLAKRLEKLRLDERKEWPLSFPRGDSKCFAAEDVDYVEKSLHQAVREARQAVEAALEERVNKSEYERLLGRKPKLSDFSGTLLLAVHCLVKGKEGTSSFVMACQVGDGITIGVDREGQLHMLGRPDSGEFSGQTDFLTGDKPLNPDYLIAKTFQYTHPMRAVITVSDGVADVYFPNDPKMLQAYADLILNQIINVKGLDSRELDIAAEQVKAISADDYSYEGETPGPDGQLRARVYKVAPLAERLGKTVEELVRHPAPLVAASAPICVDPSPGERLRTWLDCFYARGENDDRTLVVLYREEVS